MAKITGTRVTAHYVSGVPDQQLGVAKFTGKDLYVVLRYDGKIYHQGVTGADSKMDIMQGATYDASCWSDFRPIVGVSY